MKWDFVLTCFEPITRVTGGIGTYTRCLLEQLSPVLEERGLNILFLTPHQPDPAWMAGVKASNISVVLIDCHPKSGAVDLDGLGDQHSAFSFNVAEYLEEISKSGDTIGFVEFSDFGRDGYYSIKKKRLGLLRCGQLAVRLHSPDLMLLPDNRFPLRAYDAETLYKLEQEIYCYEFCDIVLFGGDNMLSRVEAETAKYGVRIGRKAQKIHHPFRRLSSADHTAPTADTKDPALSAIYEIMTSGDYVKLVYTGRIERRKGIFKFIETVLEDHSLRRMISDGKLRLIACGRDTYTGNDGTSLTAEIKSLIAGSSLEYNIILADYINQNDLYNLILPNADAFIFPSLFENYPNAFIETLPFGRPTLVSARGCMPEIGKSFGFVTEYDPLATSALTSIANFIEYLLHHFSSDAPERDREGQARSTEYYRTHSGRHNDEIVRNYLNLISGQVGQPPEITGRPSIAFIITADADAEQLEVTTRAVAGCMQSGDDVFIISGPSEADSQSAKHMCQETGARCIIADEKGRSTAKNSAVQSSVCDLIQFVDAGEKITADGLEASAQAITRNYEIDFICGLHRVTGRQSSIIVPRDPSLTALERNPTLGTMLIRRSTFAEAGGFQKGFPAPYDLWELALRLTLQGKCGEVIPRITFEAVEHPDGSPRSVRHQDATWHMRVIQNAIESSDAASDPMNSSSTSIKRAAIFLQRLLTVEQQREARAAPQNITGSSYGFPIGPRQSIEGDLDLATAVKLRILDKHYSDAVINTIRCAVDKARKMSDSEKIDFVRNSPLFDSEWYININTDVRAAGKDPSEHYALYGANEDRGPNAYLEGKEMRNAIGQLADDIADANPFIVFGILTGSSGAVRSA